MVVKIDQQHQYTVILVRKEIENIFQSFKHR